MKSEQIEKNRAQKKQTQTCVHGTWILPVFCISHTTP